MSEVGLWEYRKPQVARLTLVAGSRVRSTGAKPSSVASRLFSEVGVDVEERIDTFEQSRFDFFRRAVKDV